MRIDNSREEVEAGRRDRRQLPRMVMVCTAMAAVIRFQIYDERNGSPRR